MSDTTMSTRKRIWWCIFHDGHAKQGYMQPIDEAWCWWEYRHECVVVERWLVEVSDE